MTGENFVANEFGIRTVFMRPEKIHPNDYRSCTDKSTSVQHYTCAMLDGSRIIRAAAIELMYTVLD